MTPNWSRGSFRRNRRSWPVRDSSDRCRTCATKWPAAIQQIGESELSDRRGSEAAGQELKEIIASLRSNLKAEGSDAVGLRQAIKRQQAEINGLRGKLSDATSQLANRNERLAQLQQSLTERKQTIADGPRKLSRPRRRSDHAGG